MISHQPSRRAAFRRLALENAVGKANESKLQPRKRREGSQYTPSETSDASSLLHGPSFSVLSEHLDRETMPDIEEEGLVFDDASIRDSITTFTERNISSKPAYTQHGKTKVVQNQPAVKLASVTSTGNVRDSSFFDVSPKQFMQSAEIRRGRPIQQHPRLQHQRKQQQMQQQQMQVLQKQALEKTQNHQPHDISIKSPHYQHIRRQDLQRFAKAHDETDSREICPSVPGSSKSDRRVSKPKRRFRKKLPAVRAPPGWSVDTDNISVFSEPPRKTSYAFKRDAAEERREYELQQQLSELNNKLKDMRMKPSIHSQARLECEKDGPENHTLTKAQPGPVLASAVRPRPIRETTTHSHLSTKPIVICEGITKKRLPTIRITSQPSEFVINPPPHRRLNRPPLQPKRTTGKAEFGVRHRKFGR